MACGSERRTNDARRTGRGSSESNTSAQAINDKGQIVGTASGASPEYFRAFLYQNGVMTDLNNLIPPSSHISLSNALKINNAGQIVAIGHATGDDWSSLYLLTPGGQSLPFAPDPLIASVPEPSTLAVYSAGVAAWIWGAAGRERLSASEPLTRRPIARS